MKKGRPQKAGWLRVGRGEGGEKGTSDVARNVRASRSALVKFRDS